MAALGFAAYLQELHNSLTTFACETSAVLLFRVQHAGCALPSQGS